MKGKSALLAGAAAFALIVTAQSAEAKKKHHAPPPPDATTDSTTSAEPPAPHPASNAELEARIKALEDEVEANEAKESSQQTRLSTLEQGFGDVQWSFDNARPTVKTGDGRFSMAIRVRFQSDFAAFNQPNSLAHPSEQFPDLSTGAVVRRAYFGVEGRAFKDFWYELRLNAGGSDGGTSGSTAGVAQGGEGDPLLNKAVITYTGITNFHINVGVLEPNFMFEGTTSSAWLTFLERPEIDNIGADSFGAGDSRRGVELNWQRTDTLWGGDNVNVTVAYTGGKTGSSAGHGNGGDEQAQLLTRVSDRIWSDGIDNFQIGGSYSNLIDTGGTTNGNSGTIRLRDRPEVRVNGDRLIDTGGISAKHGFMYALDAGLNFDSLFVGGEYALFSVDRRAGANTVSARPSGGPVPAGCAGTDLTHFSCPHAADNPQFSGFYAEASYFLTGETRQYSPSALNNEVGGWQGPSAVASPFSLDGDSWGAWEVAARYSNTDLDFDSWRTQNNATASPQPGIAGGRERVVDIGLNWYLNKDIRLMLDDLIVNVHKRSGAGSSTNVGQSFNVIAVRLQFAN